MHHLEGGGSHIGALYEALQLCKLYGLDAHIVEGLETGHFMSKTQWKRIVNRAVRDREESRWRSTVQLYSSTLSVFKESVTSVAVSVWWEVSQRRPHLTKAARVLIRLLCGQHGLATNTFRFRSNCNGVATSTTCTLCDNSLPETVDHFLFSCTVLNKTREELLQNLSMPPNMRTHLLSLNTFDKTVFVLSGAGGGYVWEWMDLYESFAIFVFKMYIERSRILQRP